MVRHVVAAIILITTLGVAAPLPAFGQAGRADISGTIFDTAKAVVPGATVTVTEESTGLRSDYR